MHVRRDDAEERLDRERPVVDHPAEEDHDQRQADHREQGQQRQARADVRHRGYDEHGPHGGVHQVHQGRTGDHAERRQVVGGARHDVAGGMAVVEAGVLAEQVGEQVVPHVGFDPPAAAVEAFAHAVARGTAHHGDDDHERHAPRHRAQRGRSGQLVDGALEIPRTERGEDVREHDEQQPEEVGAAVAPHVGQEAS